MNHREHEVNGRQISPCSSVSSVVREVLTMPGKVAKIGTFSDWIGLFNDWRKEIGVNTR